MVGAGSVETVEMNLDASAWSNREPHTSLILACYRVRRYLPDFLSSLDEQTANHLGYELIFVIDGCPEHSEDVVREWAERTDYAVRIIVKQNGGVASARNAGLRYARGEWISAPDPDDWLDPGYLSAIEHARASFRGVAMFAGRVALVDSDGRRLDHPLEYRFDRPQTHLIDLVDEPDRIQTLGGTVFVSRGVIERYGMSFDERLVQASDTDFVMRYLLLAGAEYVLVPEARYEYRRRADGSSIVAREASNDLRYKVVFGQTHRAVLELAGPECPQWLANTLLYFSQWPFMRARKLEASSDSLPQSDLDEITDALRWNLRRMGAERIRAFRVVDLPLDIRAAWLAAASGKLETSPVELLEISEVRDLCRVSFTSSECRPPSGLRVAQPLGGEVAGRILETKSRRIAYLGTTWAYEHIVLIAPAVIDRAVLTSDDSFEFQLGGRAFRAAEVQERLRQRKPANPVAAAPAARSEEHLPSRNAARPRGKVARGRRRLRAGLIRLRLSLALRLSAVTGRTKRYRSAWVFDGGAGLGDSDSGAQPLEALFHKASANAGRFGAVCWYVVDAGSARYRDLHRSGFRVVGRGSIRHFLLMKNALLLLSSSLDPRIRVPFSPDVLAKTWRFVYLPAEPPEARSYRVFNRFPIDGIGAANESERAMLADCGGDYRFTQGEVLMIPGYRERPGGGEAERIARWLGCHAD